MSQADPIKTDAKAQRIIMPARRDGRLVRHPRAATIIFCGLACLLFVTLAIIVTATTILQNNAEDRVAAGADRNIRIAWRVLDERGGSFSIRDGRLYDGDTCLDGDQALIDEVHSLVGGAVTIFRGDERVATNVPGQNGGIAIGTHLAMNDAYRAVFEQHRPYRGKVDILGAAYAAAYDPITDAAGQVIGILFVGTIEASTLAGVDALRNLIIAAAVGALLLISVVFYAVGRRTAARIAMQENALRSANGNLDAALENMGQGLCYFDGNSRLIMASRRYAEMYGLTLDAIPPGTSLSRVAELRHAAGSLPQMTPAEYLRLQRKLAVCAAPTDSVVEMADGRAIAIHYQPMPDGGWVATHDDVTHRRRIESEARFMARHDALTQLGNRILFGERMAEAAEGGETCTLIQLDLDRFKEVNDTLGHPVGDMLLQAVSGRLLANMRRTDTVIRLGGDEFAIIHTPAGDQAETAELAARLISAISQPYQLGEHKVVIGTSIGIANGTVSAEEPDALLKQADIALYRAKADGRGTWRFYEEEMGERQRETRRLESDLRGALANEEFVICYQKLVDVRTGMVSGFEALLRWPHATRGLVLPADFIELAESSGLIVPLGAWVLRRAMADAARWPSHLKLAVNLSAVQFGPNLVQTVFSALETTGLPADRLELEITETTLLKNSDFVIAVLTELRGRGVKIVLDDFGTGYSSLLYLLKFPFDKIKIDKSFVGHVLERPASAAIVRAVCALAHEMGIEVLAEGVETEQQFAWLRDEGFDEVQGRLFDTERPADDVLRRLESEAFALHKS